MKNKLNNSLIRAIFFVALCSPAYANYKIDWYDVDGCQIELLDEFISPNKKYTVSTQNELCIGGIIISTGANVYIYKNENNIKKLLISRAYMENNSFMPSIRWVDDKNIEIEVQNENYIGNLIKEFDGINIIVKFNPDDKQKRRKFLERLNVDYQDWWMYNLEP